MSPAPRHEKLLTVARASRPTGGLRLENIIRAATALAVSTAPSVRLNAEKTAAEFFGEDDRTAAVLRAAVAPLMTADTAALATSALDVLLADLAPVSAAAALFARAGTNIDLSRRFASVSLPSIDANMSAAWVQEGGEIPVTMPNIGASSITRHQLAAIVILTEEVLRRTNAEASVDIMLRQAAARALDQAMFDDSAGSTERPAGLLNGVVAIAGLGGGDLEALRADITAIVGALSPISSDIGLVLHPQRAVSLQLLAPALRLPVFVTAHIEPTTILGLALPALAVGTDALEIDASRYAVVHMSDVPLEIVADGGPTADPVRSTWQTATVALRLLMGVTWSLRATGGVAVVTNTSW